MPWYFDPQSGGKKISPDQYEHWRKCIEAFSQSRSWCSKHKLSVRFKAQFCYVDVTEDGETSPSPLARLRYFNDERWSMTFFTWSNERYTPCILMTGQWQGTFEECLETGTCQLG